MLEWELKKESETSHYILPSWRWFNKHNTLSINLQKQKWHPLTWYLTYIILNLEIVITSWEVRRPCLPTEMISLSKQRPGQEDKPCTSIHRKLQIHGNPDNLNQVTEHILVPKPSFKIQASLQHKLHLKAKLYLCAQIQHKPPTSSRWLEKSTGLEESLSAEGTVMSNEQWSPNNGLKVPLTICLLSCTFPWDFPIKFISLQQTVLGSPKIVLLQ